MLKVIFDKFRNSREATNASWIILEKIIQMIISFLLSIFTARYLGPGNYGLINYAGAYIAFFNSLCTLGINSVIVKELIENPDEQGLILGTSIFLRSISSLLSAITIIIIVACLDHDEPLTIVVTALCSIGILFNVFDNFNHWFQSRYESKVSSAATLTAYIITSLYKVVLLILQKDIRWFAFASSLDSACMAVFLLFAYRQKNGQKLRVSLEKGKQLLKQSYHYILSGMMVAIYGQTDKMMLKQMLSETSVGYYSLASSVNNMWVFVLAAIIGSMTPTIMRMHSINKREFDRKNRQLYAIVIYLSILVAVMFTIFGRWAITLIWGKECSEAATPLKIICWYTMFSYLGVARNAWVVCEGKQKYLKYISFSAAIFNVFLNLLFIPVLGTAGAAIASLITQILTSFILPSFIKDMRPNTKLMLEALLLKGVK